MTWAIRLNINRITCKKWVYTCSRAHHTKFLLRPSLRAVTPPLSQVFTITVGVIAWIYCDTLAENAGSPSGQRCLTGCSPLAAASSCHVSLHHCEAARLPRPHFKFILMSHYTPSTRSSGGVDLKDGYTLPCSTWCAREGAWVELDGQQLQATSSPPVSPLSGFCEDELCDCLRCEPSAARRVPDKQHILRVLTYNICFEEEHADVRYVILVS